MIQELFLEEFMKVNMKAGGSNSGQNDSKKVDSMLPTFYNALPTESDELKQKLREEARAQFLQVRKFRCALTK